ncbi:MAG: UDP-N-acetylglucosamine 2-epimerase [Clostridium sp.]
MRKILVVTGTRAEYGLLYWTMKKIQEDDKLKLQLIVTGNHLVPEYGFTVNQIEKDGFNIDDRIDMLISSEEKSSILKSMGMEMIQMAQSLDRLKPDIMLILGDRYETFVAATCAMMMNIPIAHLNGGESTEGAVDEQIRHAITKMSHIHFPGAELYKERIIKMGEENWRVHNVGQSGIENIKKLKLLNKKEICSQLKVDFRKKIFLVTYHPTTLELENISSEIDNLLGALDKYDAEIIFTYPNADFGSKIIVDKINKFVESKRNVYMFYSLGQLRYLSLMKNCDAVIGNSSSGILEAPYFKTPVVNIGNRQKGRLRADNIIDCDNDKERIIEAIDKVIYNENFKSEIENIENVYGEGNTSKLVVEILRDVDLSKKLIEKKLAY